MLLKLSARTAARPLVSVHKLGFRAFTASDFAVEVVEAEEAVEEPLTSLTICSLTPVLFLHKSFESKVALLLKVKSAHCHFPQ